jgi:hypothetical protein
MLSLSVCFCLFSWPLFSTQDPPREIVAEGKIVAFHRQNRHPIKEGSYKGIGTYVEHWIIRISKWVSRGEQDKTQYVIVKYEIKKRGLTDEELNESEWRFKFRTPGSRESTSCRGKTIVVDKGPRWRQPVLEDFDRTMVGKNAEIPADLTTLPCFLMELPPERITK